MKKAIYFIAVVILGISISCNEGSKRTTENFQIEIIFPDTVYINTYYNGKIKYKNDLDTITTRFDDVKKYRYIDYYYLTTKNINYKDDYLKKIVKDTAFADNNRSIPLYKIKFDKLGLNYIDGIITDEVQIQNGSKNSKGEPMTRIITNYFRLNRGVYVIEQKNK